MWRGRKLKVADDHVRPTPDRARVTLFNWLLADLPGTRVLDLFAGTGVLGFEALSRGAVHATFVEHNPTACALLACHRDMLGASASINRADARQWLAQRSSGERWDIVFLDPPFDSPLLAETVSAVAGRLTPGGAVYVESDETFRLSAAAQSAGLTVASSSRAGAVRYALLRTP